MTTADLSFQWVPLPRPLQGQLVYVSSDYAIDFVIEPAIEESEQALWDQGCSMSFQTLELHLSCQSRRLLFPRGYFPKTMWKPGSLPVPSAVAGEVYAKADDGFLAGVARSLAEADGWTCVHDSSTGWIRFGGSHQPTSSTCVEFASGAVLELSDGGAVALWLHPTVVPSA